MSTFTRRSLVGRGSLAAAVLLGTGALQTDRALARPRLGADPFTLGVASGDPLPDGVVLWTRLAPEPFAVDGLGGMPPEDVRVRYEIAEDARFRRGLRRGTVVATPELGHSIHAEVHGLRPGREYFFRFAADGYVSGVGRTKTAPTVLSGAGRMTMAFISCQQWQAGFFTAYRHLAADAPDVVLHLGDYQYETAIPATGGGRRTPPPPAFDVETTDLRTYRLRYALYKADPDLQLAHATSPFVVTPDDHEVDNNYADDIDQDGTDPASFLPRRADAYRAYYEHQPLRLSQVNRGPDIGLYRALDYANLARFHVLDGRQYRSDQACGDGTKVPCAEALDPKRTMLGSDQEFWLHNSLTSSKARWNVIANQTLMAEGDSDPGPGETLSMDNWNGYEPARQRLFDVIAQRSIPNVVVVTGDAHCSVASDLKLRFDEPDASPTIGAEFLGTSITSGGDGTDIDQRGYDFLQSNPAIKFYNGQRGYQRCTIDRGRFVCDYRVVPYVTVANGPVSTRESFTVLAGQPGIQGDRITNPFKAI